MASIYSDEMKEKILADFSSKNPKVSASIIERFGENPRSKGLGSLTVEQYRDAVDAPLYATDGTTGGVGSSGGSGFMDWFKEQGADGMSLSGILGLIKNLSALFEGDPKTPNKAPRYKAPKTVDLKGMGTIGMAYGGRPERYEGGGLIFDGLTSGLGSLFQLIQPFLNELLISKYIDKDDEDEDMAEGMAYGGRPRRYEKGVADSAIYLGQKARDAGLLEDPRDPDNGMNDGGTVLNRKLFLGGGEVDGIGGERDDLVPIWASDREYVVSANGVRRMGGGNHARGIAALDEVNNNGRLV